MTTSTLRSTLAAALAACVLAPAGWGVLASAGASGPGDPGHEPGCADRPGSPSAEHCPSPNTSPRAGHATEPGASPSPASSPTPSPTPSPSETAATDESGCRDVVDGLGIYRGVSGVDAAGTLLLLNVQLAAPSCPSVTYTAVARDMDDASVVVGEQTQNGTGLSPFVTLALPLTTYTKACIRVHVIVAEAGTVHDVAPDAGAYNELCRVGPGGAQTWK